MKIRSPSFVNLSILSHLLPGHTVDHVRLTDPGVDIRHQIEVLEIGSNRLLELGMRFPDSVAWSIVGGGTTVTHEPQATLATGVKLLIGSHCKLEKSAGLATCVPEYASSSV